jgi:hypothetical protein
MIIALGRALTSESGVGPTPRGRVLLFLTQIISCFAGNKTFLSAGDSRLPCSGLKKSQKNYYGKKSAAEIKKLENWGTRR